MTQFYKQLIRIVSVMRTSYRWRHIGPTVAYTLIIISGLYSMVRGFDMPIEYPICQWFTTYEFGFIKRGLMGTLIQPYMHFKTGDEIREMIRVLALVLLLLKLVCIGYICAVILQYANRYLNKGGGVFWMITWAFMLSPHVVYTCHLAGYFDHILEICTVAAVIAIYREKYVLVPFIAISALFVHEMFAVYGLPIIGLTLILKLFGPKSAPVKYPVAMTTLILAPIIAAGVFVSCAQHVYSPHALSSIQRAASQYDAVNVRCIENMVGHLGEDISDSWKLQKKKYVIERLVHPETVKPMYPAMALFWLAGLYLLIRAKHWMAIPVFTVVSLLPLATNLVAWDGTRFASNAVFQTFIGLFAIVLVLRPLLSLSRTTHFFGVLVALAVAINSLVHPVPLMAGRVDGAGLFSKRNAPKANAFFSCRPLFPNSTFDVGTLKNWNKTGEAFNTEHHVLRPIPRGTLTAGKYWLLSYSRKKDGSGQFLGDRTKGELTSIPFTISHSRIIFQVAGGNNIHHTYAALIVEGKEIYRTTGNNDNPLATAFWDVRPYLGKTAVIKVVDQSTDSWGHIHVDQFCWSN